MCDGVEYALRTLVRTPPGAKAVYQDGATGSASG